MNTLLNIFPNNYFFQYQKSLNFDNWKLYIQNSNGNHLPFFGSLNYTPVNVTYFKLVNFETNEETNLNTNLIDLVSNGFLFLADTVFPEIETDIYFYQIEVDGDVFKSELFCTEPINSITEISDFLNSKSLLKIIKTTDNWSFENSLLFDNKELYKHFTRAQLLPFAFTFTGFTEGNLVSIKIVNYDTNEIIMLPNSIILDSYYFDGNYTQQLPDGCFYYLIEFENITLKSEIFVNQNPIYVDINYIIDDLGNKIIDDMFNFIIWI